MSATLSIMSKILQHPMVVADDVVHAEAQIELGLEVLVFFEHLRCASARSIAITSSSSISGLVSRSNAPARMASMAVSTVP